MKFLRLLAFPLVSILTLGCTKGVPSFGLLDSNAIPRPLFSGLTHKDVNSLTFTETFSIQGECDPRVTDLVGSAVGSNSALSTLQSMTVSGVTVGCSSSGRFSFILKSLQDLGFVQHDNTVYEVQLRSITDVGVSSPSSIFIRYSTTGSSIPQRIFITSGGTESSNVAREAKGSLFKGQIRVSTTTNKFPTPHAGGDTTAVKTGSDYKILTGPGLDN